MTDDDSQRTADLVELHALCGRYMVLHEPVRAGPLARRVHARRRVQRVRHAVHARAVPGAARGRAARPVHRQHAGGRASTATRPPPACSTSCSSTSTTHAMRLGWYHDEYVRTADGWRIRRRATTFMRKHGGFDSGRQHDPLAGRPSEDALDDRAPEDHQRRRPRRRARAPLAGPPAREDARAGPARRAGALGRLLPRRRRVVQAGDDRRRPRGATTGCTRTG